MAGKLGWTWILTTLLRRPLMLNLRLDRMLFFRPWKRTPTRSTTLNWAGHQIRLHIGNLSSISIIKLVVLTVYILYILCFVSYKYQDQTLRRLKILAWSVENDPLQSCVQWSGAQGMLRMWKHISLKEIKKNQQTTPQNKKSGGSEHSDLLPAAASASRRQSHHPLLFF